MAKTIENLNQVIQRKEKRVREMAGLLKKLKKLIENCPIEGNDMLIPMEVVENLMEKLEEIL